MRLAFVIGLFAWVLLAACDRLPDRGGLNEPCFGNGFCEGELDCIAGVCISCTSDCSGGICGVDDGCGGRCHGACGSGEYCTEQNECADCLTDALCGELCEPCAGHANGNKCVNVGGSAVQHHFCGCESNDDCEMGATCLGDESNPGMCEPDLVCGQPTACGLTLKDCTDVDSNPEGSACLPANGGDCECACQGPEHCTAPDKGCDLLSQSCMECITDFYCGGFCEDCSASFFGTKCIFDGSEWACACEGNEDCLEGTCTNGVCDPEMSPALLYEWTVPTVLGGVYTLNITPPDSGITPPVVVVGGGDTEAPHLIRMWALDGEVAVDSPDQTLGTGGTQHGHPLYQLAFAGNGDLFSVDEGDAGWFFWSRSTGTWSNSPADWATGTGVVPGLISAGGQDANLKVGVTTGAFNAEFYDHNMGNINSVGWGWSITDLAVKGSGDFAVITSFDDPDSSNSCGAVAVDLSDNAEEVLVTDLDAYRVALTRQRTDLDAAMVVAIAESENTRLIFFDWNNSSGAWTQSSNSYDLVLFAHDLVLAAEDEWAFTISDMGVLYAFRTSSSELTMPYPAYTDQECPITKTPLIAASDTYLVTACNNLIRVWDVSLLLQELNVTAD